MKLAIVCSFLFVAVFAADKYTAKYDNVDVDAILANGRLVKNYVKCLLEQAKCSEDGQTLKEVIPDALVTGCAKCNDKQKASVEKVIRHLYKNNKEDWNALLKKYDPEGKHQSNYKKYYDDVKA